VISLTEGSKDHERAGIRIKMKPPMLRSRIRIRIRIILPDSEPKFFYYPGIIEATPTPTRYTYDI
jgi:hypothetical protein